MFEVLDIRTLLIAVFVTHAVCLSALVALRLKIRSIPGIRHLVVGQALSILGVALYWPDDAVFDLVSKIFGNAFSVAWMALSFDGTRRFFRRPTRWPTWPLALFLLPCFAYWTLVESETEWRVLATIGPMALLGFATAWTALTSSRADERPLSALITVGYSLFSLGLTARIVSMSWNPWAVIMDAGAPSTAATFLLSNVAMIAGTFGFALVAHQRVVAELIEARETAESASRVKSEFLAIMSHEIRTPMNGVLGGVHLLLDSELGDQERRYARTIEVSGRAMVELLDDILDFARSESGHLELETRPLDVVTEVETTVGAFSEAASARGLRLDLAIDAGPDGPSHPVVLGDAVRLRQVLSNLITNALKFTPEGGVTVRLTVRSTDVDAAIHCDVEDTGIGIDKATRERLFEPFHQGDSSTARRFGGTGLGLAICRDLVGLMAGEIGVEPGSDGVGSRFWFRVALPRCTFETHDEPLPRRQPTPRSGRILVAEDNPINRFVLVEMLESLGHTVETAEDGDAAVGQMLATPFDLVLMDCQMPGTDGFEATRQIRRLKPDHDPTIIAVTAAALDENRDRCLAAGMDDFVSKPITPEALDQLLAQWLPSSTSQRTA